MAETIATVIHEKSTLLAEAGTGTGKTFAYLVPALLSGKKIIISTATKTLQEQLIGKDLPLLMKLCEVEGQARLLKGRENYLCPQRLEIAETAEQHPKSVWKKLSLIHDWQEKTLKGDKSELTDLDENDPIWHRVCARLEFCQANGCHADTDCFYPKIKQEAIESQVLVVNHHLFCADLALRENGFGELLPEADVYVFDEAHQLPDIAAQFLGFSLSRGQLEELARDIKNAIKQESPESVEVIDQTKLLEEAIQKFNQALGKWERRWNWEEFELSKSGIKTLEAVRNQLTRLIEQIKPLVERGKSLSATYKRTQEFESQLNTWLTSSSENKIRWVESSQVRFRLHLTPLSVADPFSRQRDLLGGAWIFTSATLSINHSFDYFIQRLGLQDAKAHQWESPFDYEHQALIYHPVGLPDPKSPDYVKICLRAVWPLLIASKGCAFLLFTSHKALLEAKGILAQHWQGTLLSQGDAPKSELLEKFKQSDEAILLGTSSFWEGVDVKGNDLKLVMIDRIPFIPPDDPVVQARESALKQKGLNGFFHFQIPEATIALKQGAGRLIRSTEDRGVLVLCDPRISQKSYGKIVIGSLPPFRWVYRPEEAKELLMNIESNE
ncbi:MAG: ATP-dependent DNA helicase [Hydrogenovibrio sp.]|nr:ATP-dependent DNA helicase [Hydrogenovibrio sp.]